MKLANLGALFGIDPRSLAVLRMGLGAMMLIDTAVRWGDIDAFYSDTGMMSIAESRSCWSSTWSWSLHTLNGSPEYQSALLVLAGLAGVALLLGWRTWWANLACWVLLASIHVRAPLAPNGGDMLFRVTLFWSLFVPLGRVWSLDARAGRESSALAGVASAGTAALMIQLTLVYFFTGLFKWNADWHSGQGLYYALSLDCYLLPFGQFLRGYPELLKYITWATLALELGMPLLVWCPWQTPRLRMAAIVAFFGLHVAIHFTMTVGLFSIASMFAWTVFLPREFWESRPLVWLGETIRSLVGRRAGESTEKTLKSPAAWQVSAGRYLSWGSNGVCALLIVYLVGVNIASLFPRSGEQIPPGVLRLGQATSLLQRWDMFGNIPRNDGWFAARARLVDGSVVDVLRQGADYEETKPQLVSAILPNQHWRYHFQALTDSRNEMFRESAAEYLYRRWNQSQPPEKQIAALELAYFHEETDVHQAPGEFLRERWASVRNENEDTGDSFAEALEALRQGNSLIP